MDAGQVPGLTDHPDQFLLERSDEVIEDVRAEERRRGHLGPGRIEEEVVALGLLEYEPQLSLDPLEFAFDHFPDDRSLPEAADREVLEVEPMCDRVEGVPVAHVGQTIFAQLLVELLGWREVRRGGLYGRRKELLYILVSLDERLDVVARLAFRLPVDHPERAFGRLHPRDRAGRVSLDLFLGLHLAAAPTVAPVTTLAERADVLCRGQGIEHRLVGRFVGVSTQGVEVVGRRGNAIYGLSPDRVEHELFWGHGGPCG